MRVLTAIDMLGIPATEIDKWSHRLNCPWCSEDAWAVADYFQCYNLSCKVQAASSEDLLAKMTGGHRQAEHFMAKKANRAPDFNRADRRTAERAILDLWVEFCLTPPTNEALLAMNRIQSRGLGVRSSRFSSAVLDARQLSRLIRLAEETGAEFPEAWTIRPPSVSRAFCVQTRPYTIDRIVIMQPSGKFDEIVWNRFAAGFCSLIGLKPDAPRLLAADFDIALKLQYELAAVGRAEEVACTYLDLYQGAPCPRWNVATHLLTAVPRHCLPQKTPEFFGPEDIVRIQHVLDQFPGIERSVRGMMIDYVVGLKPREQAVTWSCLRFSMIQHMIPSHVTQVPPAAASIFEQTGTKPEDSVALVKLFNGQGRLQLAADVERLALNSTIARDRNMVVKETANDYRVIRGADVTTLANFSLRITSNVTFRNHKADRYCQGVMRCGSISMDVLFQQTLLNDRVQSLEGELQRQITVADLVSKAGCVPTVIEISKFRHFVVPHLRDQAARAKPVRGVDMLGWSENRKSFTFPGFVVNMDGAEPTSRILCPSVPVLSRYKAIPAAEWAQSCPGGLDRSCHDLIAMLVASTVRYFRRCVTQPVMVAQGSDAMTVLDKLSAAFGQHEIFALNTNVREGNRVEGVHGYPLLAAGPRSSAPAGSQTPFIHLTDQGYKLPTSPDSEQAIAAGRAAQYCMRRTVEWCLSTGGDTFKESPALLHHRSLLREGRWIIEQACELEAWEVSQQEQTAIEKLLAQIPYEEAGQRMTLIDGQHLVIDIRGIKYDHDGVLLEARDMGTLAAIEGDKLMSPAVKLLPAISTYYGQTPDVTVLAT